MGDAKKKLLDEGFASLSRAIALDKEDVTKALPLYVLGVSCFEKALPYEGETNKTLLREHIKTYKLRIDEIQGIVAASDSAPAELEWDLPEAPTDIPFVMLEAKARKVLQKAVDLDEKGYQNGAVESYLDAASAYMDAIKGLKEGEADEKAKLKAKVAAILDRAEMLRAKLSTPAPLAAPTATSAPPASSPTEQQQPPLKAKARAAAPGSRTAPQAAAGGLTAEELEVLKASSVVNGRLFMPWLEQDVLEERFSYPEPWTDPEGLLPLEAAQTKRLGAYRRPSEFLDGKLHGRPAMIKAISPYSITQVLVPDCSFVASLCITSAYEQRFRKQLITRIIYPQDENGVPIYNPSGKYMVKLWVNGVARKVVVDDLLPTGKKKELLCASCRDPSELWVSIIEKAYMKVNGGYDFPGSNSTTDLFALTGWLPERILFEEHREARQSRRSSKKRALDNYQPAERVWARLKSAHEFGDCLITVATNPMEDAEAEALGLVPTHAYAVLDVKEVAGVRLLQVKNPWAKKRWKGHYSADDTSRWTPQMRKALNYDVEADKLEDNGVFWIDYASILKYFGNVYMNWNPALFSYRTVLHCLWPVTQGPPNDTYNFGHNPQYSLFVSYPSSQQQSPGSASTAGRLRPPAAAVATATDLRDSATPPAATPSVWVLLSRHSNVKETDDDDDDDMDSLRLLVYDGQHGGGKRIYYTSNPMYNGPFVKGLHSLVRFDLPPPDASGPGASTRPYTLVVSQYLKKRDVRFTLNVFCTASFRLAHTPKPGVRQQQIIGQWDTTSAGGGTGLAGFVTNPQWRVVVPVKQRMHIQLEAPKEFKVSATMLAATQGLRVDHVRMDALDSRSTAGSDGGGGGEEANKPRSLSSGAYREGFCYMEGEVEAGVYTLITSTFSANQLGPFRVTVSTSLAQPDKGPQVTAIPPEGHGMAKEVIEGSWSIRGGTAVGCSNHGAYQGNPRFKLTVMQPTQFMVRLTLPDSAGPFPDGRPALNAAVFTSDANGQVEARAKPSPKYAVCTSEGGVYTSSTVAVTPPDGELQPGHYVVIVSTFDPVDAPFSLCFYSRPKLEVAQLQ